MVCTRATRRLEEGGAARPAPKVDYAHDPLKDYLSDSADEAEPSTGPYHPTSTAHDRVGGTITVNSGSAPSLQGGNALAFGTANHATAVHAPAGHVPVGHVPANHVPANHVPADHDPAHYAPAFGTQQPPGYAMEPKVEPYQAPYTGAYPLPASRGNETSEHNPVYSSNLPNLNGNPPITATAVDNTANFPVPSSTPQHDGLNVGVVDPSLVNNAAPTAQQSVSDKEADELYLPAVYTPECQNRIRDILNAIPAHRRTHEAYNTVIQVFLARALAEKGLMSPQFLVVINQTLLGQMDYSRPADQCIRYMGRWVANGPQGPGWYGNGVLCSSDPSLGINMTIVHRFCHNEYIRRLNLAHQAPHL